MKPGRIKKSVLVLLLCLCLSQPSQAEQTQDRQQGQQGGPSSLIKSVVLVDRPDWMKETDKDQTPPLPGSLLMGIDVKTGASFKLTPAAAEAKVFIKAGHLVAGMNMIALPADGLFAGSGSHRYLLEVKAGEVAEQVKILLEIEIKSLAAGSYPEETDSEEQRVKIRLYEISLLIGNRLIHSIQKKDTTLAGLISRGKKKPAPVVHDPRYPVPGTRPPAAAISPLTLAFMALKGIKNRAKKRQQEKIRQVYKTQMTGVFLRKVKDGKEEPLSVTIKINHHRGQAVKKRNDEGTPQSNLYPQPQKAYK